MIPERTIEAPFDRHFEAGLLIRAIEGGLPLVERPFAAIGREIGLDEQQVIDLIGELQADGGIKRFGVVVRHRELGYRANAMVVWDLPDEAVARLGRSIGRMPFVTLSYRRPRRPPDWPYNLFTMIHGRNRAVVLEQLEQIKQRTGLGDVRCAVLFSGRRFKQRGARYDAAPRRPEANGPCRLFEFPDRRSTSTNTRLPPFPG
jgi:siroheme decarboxylase